MTPGRAAAEDSTGVRVAVTGAAGSVGSQVVRALARSGRAQVSAVVRRPGAAPHGSRVAERLARYEDRASLVDAFTGADVLVFIGSDGEADRVLAHHRTIVAAAELAAVRRVVLLSSQDADPDSPFCYAHTYAVTEDWVGSFGEAAVIRAGLYGEFFGRWVVDAANSGELRLPMSGARVAPVAQADVAACLAAAALSDEVPSDPVVFTGLKQYSLADLADEASRLTDRPVPSIDCTPPEFAHSLVAAGTSPWWTYAFCTLFEAIRQGRFDAPATGATGGLDGLGHPTRPFGSSLDALWSRQTTEDLVPDHGDEILH